LHWPHRAFDAHLQIPSKTINCVWCTVFVCSKPIVRYLTLTTRDRFGCRIAVLCSCLSMDWSVCQKSWVFSLIGMLDKVQFFDSQLRKARRDIQVQMPSFSFIAASENGNCVASNPLKSWRQVRGFGVCRSLLKEVTNQARFFVTPVFSSHPSLSSPLSPTTTLQPLDYHS